jgi:HEPN domain-containing protein
MQKSEYIDYWKISAAKSWQACQHLFEKGDFVECLYFAHLTLEKILKAQWVADNHTDFPPRTHNLRLLSQQTNLVLTSIHIAFLEQMNTFQMDGRYPDYRFAIYKVFQLLQTEPILRNVSQISYRFMRHLLAGRFVGETVI